MTYTEFDAKATQIYEEYREEHRHDSDWPRYTFTAHDAYKSAAARMTADEIVEVLDDAPAWDSDGVDELIEALKELGDERWHDYCD